MDFRRFFNGSPALAALLAALLALYLIEIDHGLPNRDVVWGYDANPLLPLIAAKKVFLDGWNTGWHTNYPGFHYYVLLLILTPYMAVQWLLGNLDGLRMQGGYPYGLKDFDTLFTHIAVITRLTSAAMAAGTAYWVYRIGRALRSHRAGLLAACIIGFSPAIVYYVHTEAVDVPGLFWTSAALYCYVRALQVLELRYYAGLAVLAAVAVSTNDYAWGTFLLLPIPLIAALARRSHGSISPPAFARAALDRRHVTALLVFAIAFAVAQNWVWNFSGFVNHVKLVLGYAPGAGEAVYAHSGPTSPVPRSLLSVSILGFVLGWAGFAVCLAGLVHVLLRERRIAATLLWPAAGQLLFVVWPALAFVGFTERLYLPVGLVLAVMGGVLLARVSGASASLPRRAGGGIAVAAMALHALAMDAALITDPRYQAESFLRQHAAGGAGIELYGFRSELPRADPRWNAMVLNIVGKPGSDLELTVDFFEARAGRAADWIVVSESFRAAYATPPAPGLRRAVHEFLTRLQDGESGYTQAARFLSPVTNAFGLPGRLAPPVTVFRRQEFVGPAPTNSSREPLKMK